VTLHYEAIRLLGRFVGRSSIGRQRVLIVVIGLLAAHVIEIWFFAGAYLGLSYWPELGEISGQERLGYLDLVYYSSVVYTTLGFGDMVPHGAIRMMTATEALVGFGLLTWSASFTFLEMERFWPAAE
jgi:hypothetical protein